MAKNSNISVEEMAEVGVNFGHKVSKLHPKMKQYVSGVKNNVHIFDLEKTKKELSEICGICRLMHWRAKTELHTAD